MQVAYRMAAAANCGALFDGGALRATAVALRRDEAERRAPLHDRILDFA